MLNRRAFFHKIGGVITGFSGAIAIASAPKVCRPKKKPDTHLTEGTYTMVIESIKPDADFTSLICRCRVVSEGPSFNHQFTNRYPLTEYPCS